MTPLKARKKKRGFVISPSRIEQLHAEKESLEGKIRAYHLSGLVDATRKLKDDLWAVNEALRFAGEEPKQ